MSLINRFLAVGGVAAVLAVGAGQAHALPVTESQACPPGMYGLAGDWGPGSLIAHTPQHVALMHRRYGWGRFAWHVVHNVRPPRCS